MGDLHILEALFDDKLLKILKIFLRDKETQFYLREIAKITEVPPATTYRILNKLVALHILKEIKVKKFKLYELNANDDTRYLEKFLREETRILDVFTQNMKELPRVQAIILQGEERKNSANVLVIGDKLNAQEIKQRCAEIKEKFDYQISALPLRQDQFDQISAMGLYSGKRKIIFERN